MYSLFYYTYFNYGMINLKHNELMNCYTDAYIVVTGANVSLQTVQWHNMFVQCEIYCYVYVYVCVSVSGTQKHIPTSRTGNSVLNPLTIAESCVPLIVYKSTDSTRVIDSCLQLQFPYCWYSTLKIRQTETCTLIIYNSYCKNSFKSTKQIYNSITRLVFNKI